MGERHTEGILRGVGGDIEDMIKERREGAVDYCLEYGMGCVLLFWGRGRERFFLHGELCKLGCLTPEKKIQGMGSEI